MPSSFAPSDPVEASEGLDLRVLTTVEECRLCVEAQRAIWGREYADVVPASMIRATLKVGGLLAGAFAHEGPDAELLGFAYGITGVQGSRLVHWSHMVGVLAEHRGKGIGQRLKRFQREWALDHGIEEMQWTFDPLVSGNAHFNVNLLRVRIAAYEEEMYGPTGSALHSFGTDRFVARWDLTGSPAAVRPSPSGAELEAIPLLNPPSGEAVSIRDVDGAPRVRVRIPRDILAIQEEDPDAAREWRASTRKAFEDAMEAGYRVRGFVREPGRDECFYILDREGGGAGA